MTTPTILHWLILSSLLFSIGVYGLLTRKNALGVLISLELMLNSGALNFVAFNSYLTPAAVDGQIMSIFIIALAAAEIVVAMAILVALYKVKSTTDVSKFTELTEKHDSSLEESFLEAIVSPAAVSKPKVESAH